MRSVGLVAVMMIIVGGCTSTTPPGHAVRPPFTQLRLPAPYTANGIAIEVDGLWKNGYGSVIGIDGIATNVSGDDLQLCQIAFDVIDESGVKVSSAIAVSNGLKAGQRWRFQATFTTPYAVNFTTITEAAVTTIPAKGITIGHKFDPARIDELSPGKSTIADANRLLGPSTSETNVAGNVLIQWQYIEGAKLAHVAIMFDQSGVMLRVQTRTIVGF